MTKGKKRSGLTRNDEVMLNSLSVDELKDLLNIVNEEIKKRKSGFPNKKNGHKVVLFKEK